LPELSETKSDAGGDYKYRAFASHESVAKAFAKALLDLHYDNFKSSVAIKQGMPRHDLYTQVWGVLKDLEQLDAATSKSLSTPKTNKPVAKTVTSDAKKPTPVKTATSVHLLPGPFDDDLPANVSCGGVIFDEQGRVLLRKPAGEFDGYVWTFPKGKRSRGESLEDAAVREAREECGVDAEITRRIHGVFRGGTGLSIFYEMRLKDERGDYDRQETEQVRWATPDEAESLIRQTRNPIGQARDLAILQASQMRIHIDEEETQWDRCIGALVGLAVGDAVGTAVEFKKPGSFAPVTDMVGGGPFHLKPGQWTDDTSMALCLAESLTTLNAFDPVDQLQRYVRWWKEGHLSSTGKCFDIGNQTRDALTEFMATGKPQSGPTGQYNAGNGSLMRLAPVVMAYWGKPKLAIEHAGESSKTTHGNIECVDACRYFAALLVGAVHGRSKKELLSSSFSPVDGLWTTAPLSAKVAAVAAGSFHAKNPPAIRGTGYVVECLEAALWAFATTNDFESAVLAAVNLGDDADTTAAVCGQLAGAFYRVKDIPQHWLERLAKLDIIIKLATALTKMGDPFGEPPKANIR
jgi:ADP-ribosylglycohydrolase/ADP-ribose pyrophosphatase YjhB (NUDIX family)